MLIGSTQFRRAGRGPTTTAVAVVAALVCLAAQLVSVVHEANERHVVCAEHGELSHLPAAAAAVTGETRPGDNSTGAQDVASDPLAGGPIDLGCEPVAEAAAGARDDVDAVPGVVAYQYQLLRSLPYHRLFLPHLLPQVPWLYKGHTRWQKNRAQEFCQA